MESDLRHERRGTDPLLIEVHGMVSALKATVEEHMKREEKDHEEIKADQKETHVILDDHSFYIRLLKWGIAPLTPIGVMGAILAGAQWAMAHAGK